jgi:hypothetical protein
MMKLSSMHYWWGTAHIWGDRVPCVARSLSSRHPRCAGCRLAVP